jgi:hypothetical protein
MNMNDVRVITETDNRILNYLSVTTFDPGVQSHTMQVNSSLNMARKYYEENEKKYYPA